MRCQSISLFCIVFSFLIPVLFLYAPDWIQDSVRDMNNWNVKHYLRVVVNNMFSTRNCLIWVILLQHVCMYVVFVCAKSKKEEKLWMPWCFIWNTEALNVIHLFRLFFWISVNMCGLMLVFVCMWVQWGDCKAIPSIGCLYAMATTLSLNFCG